MKSKISFFNAGLFRSTLRRFWPLWTIHFAGWLLFLPVLTLMNNLGPNKSTNFIFAICENAVFAFVGRCVHNGDTRRYGGVQLHV